MRENWVVAWVLVAGCGADEGAAQRTDIEVDEVEVDEVEVDEVEVEVDDAVQPDIAAETTPELVEEVRDPCAEVSCETPPSTACNGDRSGWTAWSDTGTCAAGACSYSSTEGECAVGESFCTLGECMTHEAFCVLDDSRRWSYVTKLAGGNQSDPDANGVVTDACCFDFDGDGDIDNRLGEIFWQNRALLGDIKAVAATNIARGLLSIVFEVRGLEDATEPLNAPVVDVIGASGSGLPSGTELGMGTTGIKSRTFLEDSGLPRGFFTGSIVDGLLEADGGQALVPTGGTNVQSLLGDQDLVMYHLKVRGRVAIGPNGHGLTMSGEGDDPGLRYAGLMPARSFYELMNATVETECQCALYEPGVPAIDPTTGICNTPISAECDGGEPYCNALTGPLCSAFMSLFAPDIDSEGDGQLDSLSVGFWVEATSVDIGDCGGILE